MPADRIHLVRHGEVFNPDRILYGRLPDFHLSELGVRMAKAAADSMASSPISAIYASPLERTQESARPWTALFGLEPIREERIIEPTNRFEGGRLNFGPRLALRPRVWPLIINPLKPSWGEPFTQVAARVLAAMKDAWEAASGGEVVMVSHQMPICMAARSAAGKPLPHDPRKRRCTLSSITSFERRGNGFVEVSYREPAKDLLAASVDLGAV